MESQAAFAKKLIDANTALVTAVLETVAPLIGIEKAKTVKAAAKGRLTAERRAPALLAGSAPRI